MNSKRAYIVLLLYFSIVPVYAQVDAKHYVKMYNIIEDSLLIDNTLVSDTLHKHETLFVGLFQLGLKDTQSLFNQYAESQAEYSNILHSSFNIKECKTGITKDIIYFSFLEDSYISAYVFLGVNTSNRNRIIPFPAWGHYKEWYEFIFQIKEDNVILLKKTQFFEM